LIHGYRNFLDRAAYDRDPVRELTRVYIEVRRRAKQEARDYLVANGKDPDDGDALEDAPSPTMDACRAETAKLHAGDPANYKLWQEFLPHSMDEVNAIYRRLGIRPFDFV